MNSKPFPGLDFELRARDEGYSFVAGVDEVGRGCLAGPVVAGAVILDLTKPIPEGLNDSKKLSKTKRDNIDIEIREHAVAFAVGQIEADEIDRINILEATKQAMLAAIGALNPSPDHLLIDALQLREFASDSETDHKRRLDFRFYRSCLDHCQSLQRQTDVGLRSRVSGIWFRKTRRIRNQISF